MNATFVARPLACVALICVLASVASAQSPRPQSTATPVGTWRGTSTCLVRPSACSDETVVYRITQMKAADSVAIDGRRIARGEEQEMGVLGCQHLSTSNEVTCVIPQGTWHFTIRGDSLTGELRRNDNTRLRDVRTARA